MDDSIQFRSASGVYRIICASNERIYIGSAIDIRRRWQEHRNALNRKIHPNKYLQHAWNKYGEKSFLFEVIELVLPHFCMEREQYWLDTLKPFAPGNGFNIARLVRTPSLGVKISPETREKLRISHLGKPGYWTGKKIPPELLRRITPETREKIRTANLGRTVKPETREKLRQANLGKKHDEASRQRMRDGHSHLRGKSRDPEVRKKISLAKMGHPVSDETKAKLIANHRNVMKTVIVTSPDGVEYSVVGLRQFCKEHNLDRRSIQRVAQGKYAQYKGWKARFPD